MGFFDKLFGSKAVSPIEFASPVTGKVVDASAIPDPTFSANILGPCVGIEPSEGVVYSPCDGVVEQIFKTGHACTVVSESKVEILIHVGINTVDLKGEGFKALVQEGTKVKKGDALIEFDIEGISAKGFPTVVPVVVCNAADFNEVSFVGTGPINSKDKLCTITTKQ